MCGRFTLAIPEGEIYSWFDLALPPENLRPRYNISPTQTIAAIRAKPEGWVLDALRWGLIPHWAKDLKTLPNLINARGETVHAKPAFRSALKKRRCLIPADGFYEWHREGKSKIPHYFHMKGGEPFAIAGLWETWTDAEGKSLESCTLVTTSANALLEPIHDRMPVILLKQDYALWLDPAVTEPEKVMPLVRPLDADLMTSHVVSRRVNNARFDEPECRAAAAAGEESID